MAGRSVLGRGIAGLIESERSRGNHGVVRALVGAVIRATDPPRDDMGKDGALVNNSPHLYDELVMREKQLAVCTRAMIDAATRLEALPLEVSQQNEEVVGPAIKAIADALKNTRANGTPLQMEAVIQKMRREYVILLTPWQARALDGELMKRAKGQPDTATSILYAGERYPLDAAREID